MKILTVPHQSLTTPGKQVKQIDAQIHKLIEGMTTALLAAKDPMGVGLSGPQVGAPLHVFVLRETPESAVQHFINPIIIAVDNTEEETDALQDEDKTSMEGCLSIPGIWAPIERDRKIQVRYQTLNNTEEVRWFTDLGSVAVQHEIDHLHGILFTQRALEQDAPMYKEVGNNLVPLKSL